MKARLLALFSAVLCSVPAWAAEPAMNRKVDLDGDGKPEAVTLKWHEDKGSFTLQVGGATFASPETGLQGGALDVVDLLEGGDKWKEVAVSSGFTDGDKRIFLFGFDGKAIKPLGEVHSLGEVKGNGIVLSQIWMGFWNRTEKYALDRKTWSVRRVPQPLYYVGKLARVKQSFPLAHSREDTTAIANLAPGTTIEVLAASVPERGGEPVHYLIKSATGLLGWTGQGPLTTQTEGLPFAGPSPVVDGSPSTR
ncbi:hypothetical protein [Archangium primigenium]|uniref:hypothetical protein n=1 Tax=[Archangium] primigenium TaxID=2792470 RepID=UPI00195CAF7E|nr:hypothetical protein [Archangium primigenium]MBM7115621.1 hypothetical protein [Archangium primigenium]